ncbi:uncharacterized protein LOC112568048 isoform X3 [Pomacea canaliculata]|uniref:uncharacterized protein LOC112568048 isoform X3 n=1 Tax=Pomacea canaliculata TaxID=400727 RepID=UPI000D73E329|nr:uncharacterized protein LOC112568048 isoform X3 [Pomacea canaliculata]
MSSLLYITFVLFLSQAIICSNQKTCSVLQFYHLEEDLLSIMEDHHINVTFGMNMSACNQSSQLYRVTVYTSTNNGSLEYDGSITFSKDECSGTRQKSVRCITSSGPAQLYRRVNRSHELIVWEWLWKDYNFSTMRKELKLIVAYPPSVKSLTVNGQDADDSYILERGQKVEISCLFDQGNPPSNVWLSDEHGKEIKSYRGEQYLDTSFTANCDQHPSSVRCEGNSSENSKSVFFLVRCRPQFIDKAPEIIDYETQEGWKFRVKAYSTKVQKCLLAPSVVGENKNKEVNCTLTGSPPSLVLTIVVDKEECSQSGHWALTVFNEKGSSDMLVFSVSSLFCSVAICPTFVITRL